jgi:ABC-type transport system involved in multi-copper enzyme maturation permease subunit
MKMLEVLRFELGYQARRPWTWVYVVAALLMSLVMTHARVDEAQSSGVFVNAPYVIMMLTLVGSGMALLASAAFAGDAGARDPESRIAPLVYTSPVDEKSYVAGRFIAAFLLNLVVLTAFQVAMLGAMFVYEYPPELAAPITITTYLSAFILFAVPNALLATAFLFLLSLLTRRALSSYLGGVLLLFVSIFVWAVVAGMMGYWGLARIIDPFGMSVVSAISKTTTAPQKNVFDMWTSSSLLLNRAVWLSISAIILAVAHLRFRFETAGTRAWRRSATELPASVGAGERSAPIVVPEVKRSAPFAIALQQFLAVATQSFREIAISWGGLVLVVLSAITAALGPKAMSHFGVPILTTTEQMIDWIGHPGEIIWFIVPILSVFYAGELVWRDRDTRLSEIADAAPVPEWIQLLGKFVGLALLLVAYQVMLIVACMIIQLETGYTNLEPALYVKAVLGLSLTEHLLFAGLAFALHVVINQKYVAYLAIIAVYWVMAAAPSLGIENHLFVFDSSPDWTYSDMSGFGPSLIPWMWFKAYWAGWVVLLLVLASLLWVRGKEQGVKARVRALRSRLTMRSASIAVAALAVIIGTSGFIIYNTSVLNPGASQASRVELRGSYEKTYRKFAGLEQPKIDGISLRAEVYPRDRKAVLHTTYTLVNRGTSSINTIHFVPEDEMDTSDPVFDSDVRTVVNDEKLHYGIYQLSSALAPGDSLHVTFDVRYAPKGFTNDGVEASVVENGTAIDVLDWLPDIGYQSHRELSERSDRLKQGLGPRPAARSLDDSTGRYSGNPQRIPVDVVVGTDGDQIAVAPGELRRAWTESGRKYFHYVTDAPIRNDVMIYSARYAIHTERWNGVQIQVVHHPEHTLNVKRIAASARASLDYFTKNFGPYPYRELRFVEYPGQSMTLHASPINISYQEAFAGLNSGADKRGFDLAYAVVAHETGHQWWGNQLSPADIEGSPLLTESLAWYSAMCIVAATRGEDHLQRLLDMFHGSAWMISRGGPPLLRMYDRWAAYRKGPFAMMALREYLGERPVNVALRSLFDKYKAGQPPSPTSNDLYAELEAVTPDSVRTLLSDLFERNTYWEVATKNVSATPLGNDRWRVTLNVNTRKIVVDKEGGEKEVPMNDLIEIGVYGQGGSTTRGVELYRALHRLKAGTEAITIDVKGKPARAGIDPRYLLIDADPSNNIREVVN